MKHALLGKSLHSASKNDSKVLALASRQRKLSDQGNFLLV
jgi:hypothetical protein